MLGSFLVSYLIVYSSALTTQNVVRVVEGLQWGKLCAVLQTPSFQRRKIENEFASENQRRTAAVNFYLHNYPYASWRHVIRKLDLEGEHHKIHSYAEKLSGKFNNSVCL